MTIYNSQLVNNDPEPYVIDFGPALGTVRSSQHAGNHEDSHYTDYEPRPEYDNNPSEILVAFRAAGGDKNPRGGVGAMAARVLRNELVWDLDYREPDMKDHALKVLEKLVRVYGDDIE